MTDRFIEFDMGGAGDDASVHHLYDDDMYPWEWLVEQGFDGSAEQAREHFLHGSAVDGERSMPVTGSAIETDDDQVVIEREGLIYGPDVFVKRGGKRWQEVRSWFEGIKKPYETALSFPKDAFISPGLRMGFAVDDLTPAAEITDADVDQLSNVDLTVAGDEPAISKDLNNRLLENDKWSDARTADGFLEGWQGRGAQIFKWVFLERRPSILLGQASTAKALQQSVEILEEAYRNVRIESFTRIWDAEEIFELYPDHSGASGDEVDWVTVLNTVAGAATVVAGGASMVAWTPHGATVAGIATIVAGGATIAANVVGSPGHEAEVDKEIKIDGDTVYDLYWNWYDQIQSFIRTVLNSEQVIGQALTDMRLRIEESKSNDGASLETTFGDKEELTEYYSFFVPLAAGEGSFTPGTVDGMGPASPNGDTGVAFSGDLNELFKAAVNHLPAVADVYRQQAGRDADADMASATQRTVYETAPYGSETSASQSNGAALQPWLDLHAAFQSMMTESETNYRDAAEQLRAAAISYRDGDDEAASYLDEVFQDLEEIDLP
ncbi:hypothetical protein ACFQ3B_12490 [Stackebrandtia endophytica]|uniref:hypothetical protein n=1 Tax=Stackebrandtia endophytica TaxID=1496996 RepID=UPI0011507BE7|nr:hypothetical protein [Stackebrandtia endophytica]